MEDNEDEKYKKRLMEVNNKLQDSKIKKKIDNFLNKMMEELNCDIEIIFNVYPEVEEYDEYMNSDEFEVPKDISTMKLNEFVDILKKEDMKYNVFIDPLYLNKKGLNEIKDMLLTTVDDNIIIVPISNKNNKK